MKKSTLSLFTLCFPLFVALFFTSGHKAFYRLQVMDGEGKHVRMNTYKGKVLLIVNTATQCGFTPQYQALESLYEKYKDKGFVVLDFPCNQFGGQAPGSYNEIHDFCTGKYNITFPQFAKIDVNGDNQSKLFAYLKKKKNFEGFDQTDPVGKRMHQMMLKKDPDYAEKSDIKWNFTKFLISRKGKVVERFEPTASFEDIEAAVVKELER